MKTKIEKALKEYSKIIAPKIVSEMEKTETKVCEKCQKNINLIKANEHYKRDNPTQLNVPVDSEFDISYDHLKRISQHDGMPCVTTHDSCPVCYTQFYSTFEGFDSDVEFNFSVLKLDTTEQNIAFLKKQKSIYLPDFAEFLNNYFANSDDTVKVYVSLDKEFKRKNHDYLVSLYEKEGRDLSNLDDVNCYLTKEEAYTASRIGWLFEKEFIQEVEYPINKIKFEFDVYGKEIDAEINIKEIKNPLYYDVYKHEFVAYEELDFENIHVIKRNYDMYEKFGGIKKEYEYDSFDSLNITDEIFDEYFDEIEKELLTKKLGNEYIEYKEKERKKEERMKDMMNSMREHFKENPIMIKKQEEEPTELNGFERFDNVVVKRRPYKDMKGCIERIDFKKEKVEVVFFGETDSDNKISFKIKDCEKVN